MSPPHIDAPHVDIASDCLFGDDVRIDAEEVVIGPGCAIGFSGDDDFRTPPGVRIKVRSLALGPNVTLGRAVRIDGGDIHLDEGVRIQRYATIRVLDRLHIGAYGSVGEYGEIAGRHVEVGQELWMLPHVKIGGGSAFEQDSRLDAGHYLHVGTHSLINTARPVRIGDEVGLGTRTAIYTHGAYPSRLMGFPVAFAGVEIGDFTWVPGAIINPGVQIGKNCVIGVNSLVTRNIPDGCLAGGSPAKILRADCFPTPLSGAERLDFFEEFFRHYARILRIDVEPRRNAGDTVIELDSGSILHVATARDGASSFSSLPNRQRVMAVGAGLLDSEAGDGWTLLDTSAKRVRGIADSASARLLNELRRFGIRFYSRAKNGVYSDWR
jgi:acetyltransferase-like isoleucine patch superfamily enzyme